MSTHYTSPRYVERAYACAFNSEDPDELRSMLEEMTDKHDNLLKEFYRTIDNYSRMLQEYGPYHEVELGEPLSRFESILRKALNDNQ